jgi:hypothetical protein
MRADIAYNYRKRLDKLRKVEEKFRNYQEPIIFIHIGE